MKISHIMVTIYAGWKEKRKKKRLSLMRKKKFMKLKSKITLNYKSLRKNIWKPSVKMIVK